MLFLREKQVDAFLILRNQDEKWHLSKIAKETGTTYVYITKLMSILEKKGLVMVERKPQRTFVKLTEKGIAVAKLLEDLKREID